MSAEATDREIVDLLIAFMESFKSHFVVALERLDLSNSQGHVLMCLREPTPMSGIAKRIGFDASHVTALIDRLEQRGLIERRPDPLDRRVKLITLTDAGSAVQEEVRNSLYGSLVPLARLNPRERIELRDLLATATGRTPGVDPLSPRSARGHDRPVAAKG